ncbi:MAG: hypothetical protein ACF8R9_05500 [Phycisphaerales bacterium JB054]
MSDQPSSEISIECTPQGRSGKFAVVLSTGDGGAVVRHFVLADSNARRKFVEEVCDDRPGIDPEKLASALEEEAASQLRAASEGGGGGGGGRESQADRIVAMVLGIDNLELFHSSEGKTYVTLPVDGRLETYPLSSRGFKDWVAHRSYTELGKVPGAQAVQDALAALGGKAMFEGNQHDVHLRLAARGDEVWLDLGGADWRAVRITAAGWNIVSSRDVPVKFIRHKAMLPLPVPVRGGSIEELRPLVNMPDDETWTLSIGWLVGAFRPTGPYGVLSVSGEQGSAKSTACKLFRGLIDPNFAPLRRLPKNERDLFIMAGNSWMAAFNNMSGIRPEMSDALCALATDGGFATRQLYADDEESIFSARRPVLLNGIDDPASRSDLVDRTISVSLRRIAEEDRRTEDQIMAEYERVRPGVLGALLDAVVSAIEHEHEVTFPTLPRMADLTIWATAAERGLGWEDSRFHSAFMGNRAESHQDVVAASPVGPPIVALVQAGRFEGTATDLLKSLNQQRGDTPPPKEWPSNYSGMSAALKRLAPNLRAIGMSVELPERGQGRAKRRVIRLEYTGNQRTARAADDVDGGDTDGNAPRTYAPVQPDASGDTDTDRAALAARPVRTQSNRGDDPWRD